MCLCVLAYCWRTYRVDGYRQSLFALRDELFDLAIEQWGLDNPAYRNVRELLNSAIRFAHHTTLLRLWLSVRLLPKFRKFINESAEQWEQAIASCESPLIQERLRDIHQRFRRLMIDHLVSVSLPPVYVLFKLTRIFRLSINLQIDAVGAQALEIDAATQKEERPFTTSALNRGF